MIAESKWKQFGKPNATIRGIVVHNTNNPFFTAEQLEKWLNEECKTSQGCHYIVDHKEIRQVMPLDWSVWNTGKGMDFGNLHCISVEICTNPNSRLYYEGERKAVGLIKELMKEYGFGINNLYYHRDFNPNVNCPAQVLKRYKSKADFLRG